MYEEVFTKYDEVHSVQEAQGTMIFVWMFLSLT